ncbi:LOW QUALITY PROTEIN: integral membrane protein, partial [Streptomyces lividans TK24]
MPKGYSLRSYLTAATAARAGDEMSGPALLLAGLAVTGSTTDASTLLAGITVSAAVGGPVLGALLDRAGRPGRLLAGALALYATGLMVILAGLGRIPMACTLPLAVLTGLLGPALSGGWTAQLPRVAADARLSRANALDAMTFGVASLAGPALAGGVAELLGASTALALAAALITAAVPAAWRLPAGPVRDRGTRSAPVAGALKKKVPGRPAAPAPGPGDPHLGRLLRRPGHAGGLCPAHRRPVARHGRARRPALLRRGGVRPGRQRRSRTAPAHRRPRHGRPGGCPGPGGRAAAGGDGPAGGAGGRRARPRHRRRPSAHRALRGTPPGDPGAPAGPGLHHRGEPQDHRVRPGCGRRRPPGRLVPAGHAGVGGGDGGGRGTGARPGKRL